MHAPQEQDRRWAPDRARPPVRTTTAPDPAHAPAAAAGASMTPAQVMALQRAAGNAAVVQRLAADEHTHGDGCGHAPSVQRSTVPDVLSTSGRPFTGPLAERVEAHYGDVDLSHLRVHTDPVAQRSAAEIGARAYTSGHHMVLGADHTEEDVRHEVFHTFQQAAGPVSGTDNGDGLKISAPDSSEEKEATAAARTPSPEVPSVQQSSTDSVQRVSGQRPRTPHRTHGPAPVQRMFSRRKAAQQGPPQVELRVGDATVQAVQEGGFHRFTTKEGGTAFIHDVAIHNGVVGSELAPFVTRYLNGGLMMYRGIARWHPTWHAVVDGSVPPLGAGFFPDFDTRKTSFIPFAPTENIARGAAIGTRGMGDEDQAQFVEGYSRQGEHEVGMVITAFVGPNTDVGFFNATEIQVRGPVEPEAMKIMTMGTDVTEALTGTAGDPREELRNSRPRTPTDAEKDEYIAQHGALRK